MESDIKVSVILPVYNVEQWIGDCIASLRRQKLDGLEFIFIDDCGTDNSMDAVEEWAANDGRVRIIRNETNIGTGPSRNRGIEEARGEYLSFIDPDDWISDNFYESLYAKAKKNNSAIAKGIRITIDEKTRNVIKTTNPKRINNRIVISLYRRIPLYCTFVIEHQTAVYKRELFITHPQVRYGTSKNAQDTTFLLRVCLETDDISIENKAVYYYLKRDSSATGTYTIKRSLNELDALREMIDTMLNYPKDIYSDRYIGSMMQFYINDIHAAIITGKVDTEEKENYIKALNEQIMRLPDKAGLFADFPAIEAIAEYREILPAARVRGAFSFCDCVDAWILFLIRHPEADRKYSKECAQVVGKCRVAKLLGQEKLSRTPGAEHRTHYSTATLDKKRRREVISYIPSSMADLFINLAERVAGPIIIKIKSKT